MSERQHILNSLKTKGELTAAQAAAEAGLTSMGARGHLERLEQIGLVQFREEKVGRGRPKRLWYLTAQGHQQFPQQYDQLSLELIDNIKDIFGQVGLDKLIQARENKALAKYKSALQPQRSADQKIQQLARERTDEGYMAEVIVTDRGWQLTEHHCPICAAAETCQGFCDSELAVFQQSLGDDFTVVREEHLLGEGERCRYQITLKEQSQDLS